MYRLTELRLKKAKEILERYRSELYQRFSFDAHLFEIALRKCWNVGYQEMKDLAEDMLKNRRYRHVALYYMQYSSAPGVVCEFQPLLAKAYGLDSWHYDPNHVQKRAAFWADFKREAKHDPRGTEGAVAPPS